MELYIRIKNGQPFEHPIMGDNFRDVFPDLDVNNLPPEFAKFERVEKPVAKVFEIIEDVTYQWQDGIVKDTWVVRAMTQQEREQKIQQLINSANEEVVFRKEFAQQGLSLALTDEVRQAWTEYIETINAWTLMNPADPKIPHHLFFFSFFAALLFFF